MWKKIVVTIFAVLIFCAVFAVYLRKDLILSNEQAIKSAALPSSKFMTWKGNQIHYTDEGSGPVILMIHGFGGSYYNFQAITEKLKGEFRIIRPDIPGMGLSEFKQSASNPHFFNEYKDFFQAFFNEIGTDSMYVMGNSLGGAMAYLVAAEFPQKVKQLILLNSAGYELKKVIAQGAGPLRWKWFRPFVEKGIPLAMVEHSVTYPFADKTKVDTSEFRFDYALINRNGNIHSLIDLASSGQEPDTSIITKIQCPTLILWGKEDKIIPVEHAYKFNRDIKGSIVKIYSPCGHMPMMELPDSVIADFKKFRIQ